MAIENEVCISSDDTLMQSKHSLKLELIEHILHALQGGITFAWSSHSYVAHLMFNEDNINYTVVALIIRTFKNNYL